MGQRWPATGSGTLHAAVYAWDLLKEVSIIFITSTIVWPQERTTRREHSTAHQQKIGLKIYWAWSCLSEQGPGSPFSQPLPSGSFHRSHSYPSEGRQNEKHNHIKLIKLITWITTLSNSMKLWSVPYRATQDRRVMLESSDKAWSTGERKGKPLHYSCLENPINSMKRQKARKPKDELSGSVGAQYATGDQWRNEEKEWRDGAKAKPNPAVVVTGDHITSHRKWSPML